MDDWKERFPSAAAANAMRTRITKWLDMLEGDNEARRHLHHSLAAQTWRENFDFTGVPPEVMERTAKLVSSARAAIDRKSNAEARLELEKALKVWS